MLIGLFAHYLGVLGVNCLVIFLFLTSFFVIYYNFITIFFSQQAVSLDIGAWFSSYNIDITWEFQNTLITSLLAFIVISISFLIHIYSMYYMDNDTSYIKFIMLLSLFTFFMLFLIFSSQLVTILVGWEAVGICSFLLINFWGVRQEANQSAIKAVLFNKIGDLGFIFAILVALQLTLETDLVSMNTLIIYYSKNLLFFKSLNIGQLLGYSLLLAAFGKSAQFFFHLWLTDAMEGPTPVSGLIHSATMVIAGVFLIIQTFPIINTSAELLLIIMFVGTVSTLITSLVATTSFDIKRIIANSTASHIGLMFMALGLGDLSISLFHLTTHAYFKAFGFLLAGYLIHLLGNEQDSRWMAGIFNILPIVSVLEEYWCITMLNLPNSSSYYSKELFFNSYWAYNQLYLTSFIIYVSFFMCFLSFICSTLYIAYLLSWLGDKVSIKKMQLKHVYESKWLPLSILLVLALCSQLVGFSLFNLFFNQNAFYIFNNLSLFYFIADWSEFYLLYSSFAIITISIIIDIIEDYNYNWDYKIINLPFFIGAILVYLTCFYSTLTYGFMLLLLYFLIKGYYELFQYNNNANFTTLIRRVTSFSLDSLFNFSLYNSNIKGLNIFVSIDNFLLETANHITFYKKVSFYLQKYTFNRFILQININLILIVLFLLFILV